MVVNEIEAYKATGKASIKYMMHTTLRSIVQYSLDALVLSATSSPSSIVSTQYKRK